MIEYKNASFYTEYFKSIDGFCILDEFTESKDGQDKNHYIGRIEVLGTIHPLIISVEIPFTFPHNKLVFRTKSISGYPHLIHSGKIHIGDWFCLNTPFAETTEEQLNLEVFRLKEWISRQMREDLPAIIKDPNVKYALAFANAYEWENLDEVKEFSSKAILTFIGDFHEKIENFKDTLGYLDCIKSPDNRFYVIDNVNLTNYKLPYIIVNEAPPTLDIVSDFIKLRDYYNWDYNTCKHLLPDLEISTTWQESPSQTFSLKETKLSSKEKLSIISKIEEELNKEDSYLSGYKGDPFLSGNNSLKSSWKLTKVLPSQKAVLYEELRNMKDEAFNPEQKVNSIFGKNFDDMTEDELAEQQYNEDYAFYIYPFEWHQFALGLKYENRIIWSLLCTYRKLKQVDSINYDLGIKNYRIEKIIGQTLHNYIPQIITEEMYYGRGSFHASLISKKIALVGLGAIGSMVAEALAKSGCKHIALWDNDIVEAGNICRSSYCLKDIGESKVNAISRKIESLNPYAETIIKHGRWHEYNVNYTEYIDGSFYANVNYNTQEKAISEIRDYDLIIDCTGSNEMLHFLSYAIPGIDLISLCITNHAKELLCISNRDGNPFELRKAYLSRIEQDTKNFYIEGNGCYSPTFLAANCDIAALVNLALGDLNKNYENGYTMPSTIYSYTKRGILADRMHTYKLPGYDIILNISSETLYDAEDMADEINGELGYLFGCYDRTGKQIMITHVVDPHNAVELLTDAYNTSRGLIDYIGDYTYSGENPSTYNQPSYELLATKAEDPSINTNNPLLAVRNPDNTISFFLYINNGLEKFTKLH